jgi:hypothetical protein
VGDHQKIAQLANHNSAIALRFSQAATRDGIKVATPTCAGGRREKELARTKVWLVPYWLKGY